MNRFQFPSLDRQMLIPKAVYFCFFAAVASLGPFLVLYYEQTGLTGWQIGLLTGLFPLLTLISSPLFGAVADVTQQHDRLLKLAIVATLASVVFLLLAGSFLGLLIVVIIYALAFAPIQPLIDKTVLDLLGERKADYGRHRLWGSVGWGLAAPLVGGLADQWGLAWSFYGFLAFMSLTLLTTFGLQVQPVKLETQVWRGMASLLTDWRWFSFLVILFTSGMGLAILHNYLFLYLAELGASRTLMGFALTIATVSEMVVMFFAAALLRQWGTKGVLALSAAILAVRLLAYSVIDLTWLVLLLQLSHGPTFAAMWVASVARADELAPPGMGATAQGLQTSISMGIGSACGAFLGGILYEWGGVDLMFRGAGVGVLLGLGLFVITERWLNKPKPLPEAGV
ncbi:MAG: MFS transporter [Anaerolineae bacterium]|nr:MFS transporter [Anaerolineae bacterium]